MNESLEKLVKAGTLVCLVLALFIAVLVINGIKENKYIGGGVPGSNVITVSGTGEVTAVPDVAEVTFEVVTEKPTVEAAQTAAAEDMNAILAFIKKEGIDEKDIKTTNYSANPRYEWRDTVMPMSAPSYGGGADAALSYPYPVPDNDTRVLVGYEVRQSVSVKIRDTEKTGAILAGVGGLGATNIYGPTFTIDDEDELQREARQEAIDDARTKAEQLADDLDVKLVRIVSFSESGGGYYPMYRGLEAAAYDSSETKVTPEIPAGENTISAYVTITYEIR